ncbi:chitin disaccharide deacetylase [Brevibacillus parabrevis]|uniref:chitin disaccharide deacetylase n=1 Tax=Brevibacillus parabrevis TaxID=54914 RepID=UPI0028D75259|nr:chitin disaccharide deacetylase [Brevibacillus parabrevis]
MKLIVNADDFGYSKGVNLGIIEAHRAGVVTSTTTMVNMGGFEHAVQLARETPTLGVGIHLVLTCGAPVSHDVPSLTDEHGRFHRGYDYLGTTSPEDVEKELRSQIEKYLATGLAPTHIDSHHHVHAHAAILPIVLRLAQEYRLPVRNPWGFQAGDREKQPDVLTTEGFSHRFYGEDLSVQTFFDIVEELADCSVAEMMTHPAYLDEAILTGSSYALPRTRELQILTAKEIKEYVQTRQIQLVTFKELG